MWILNLWANKVVRWVLIGALAILLLGYALRRYSNRVYSEGYQSGKVAAATEMERAKKAEWAARETAIAADAAKVGAERRAVVAATDQLAQARATIARGLKDGLAAVQARKEANYAGVAAVPASELDSSLRAVSAELAAAH